MIAQISDTRRKRIIKRIIMYAALLLFILLIIFAYLSEKKKSEPAFNADIDYSFDMGLTTIDLKYNAGLSFKLNDIPFSNSASKQDTQTLKNNMKTVTASVKNSAKTPITLSGNLSNYVDVNRDTGERTQLACPGLTSCFYYYNTVSKDAYLNDADKLVAAMSPVDITDGSKTSINLNSINDSIILEPGQTYQLVWVLWVNSDVESQPSDKTDYGINVDFVAREVY